jgi:predicted nucleic-acid-binding protein
VIGLDTNVLVRYVVRDDPDQTERADALLEALNGEEPGFLSLVALVELYWTLGRAYRYGREQCTAVLAGLTAAPEIRLERADMVRLALQQAGRGADFADAVIAQASAAAGCSSTVTFDRGAARSAGMTLLR